MLLGVLGSYGVQGEYMYHTECRGITWFIGYAGGELGSNEYMGSTGTCTWLKGSALR